MDRPTLAHSLTLKFGRVLTQDEWRAIAEAASKLAYVQALEANTYETALPNETARLKAAFWKTFLGAGELWFPSPERESREGDANRAVEQVWDELTGHLSEK